MLIFDDIEENDITGYPTSKVRGRGRRVEENQEVEDLLYGASIMSAREGNKKEQDD